MKYAVVSSGGKQFKVAVGDIVEVAKLSLQPNDTYTFPQILLIVDDNSRTFGVPHISDVMVIGKVIDHAKKKKVRVANFKAKARYRSVTGHRQQVTRVKIEEIGKDK